MKLLEIWDSKIFRQQADAARQSQQVTPQQDAAAPQQSATWQFEPGDRVILRNTMTKHYYGTVLHQIPGSHFNKDPNNPLYPDDEKIYQVEWDDTKPDGSPFITYEYEHELEFE